mmetsp:Transcript_5797/g.8355  ORF Transcript_5797/g.8355 Transcript_5797/m.8355 type:complete len:752 (+) Transcript_5797:86-2341(+)|eukprot:CAMPEP_0195512652 /NCGR_PEP_ID=MMETSP0794_2-20130614/4541_1 /TAXON_ID=515487 /ORGANISM="Stephanopyxis turris, Strain CCMP 815" /LENGTH=751 /DNA_ID=CAMNT_0040640487 /DNA_START=86 /DNA_END=2341 /DNA_ORIENTATION=-
MSTSGFKTSNPTHQKLHDSSIQPVAKSTPTTSEDLTTERSRATFSPLALTHLLDGGAHRTARRRYLESLIENDPTGVFCNRNNHYLHRRDRHIRALAKSVRLVEIMRMLGMHNSDDGAKKLFLQDDDFPVLLQALADDLPLALHWVMFVPNIQSLCDEEQQARWLPLCRDLKMIGCYAQTELGHGSNVRALETTATFRPSADGEDGEWVIHSPTLTATKFWPGTLGRTANHAMVIARLIDGSGTDRGIHNFLVPLRSMTDHTPLRGVSVGDIGPKIGYNNMDNGFAKFDHVVIPRRNMAMRFSSVDRDGKYRKKEVSEATSKVAYITMMQVRAYIIADAGKFLAMASTITIRYSAVRRQGFDEANGGAKTGAEVQILDYSMQQYRLLTLLASSYVFDITGKMIMERLLKIQQNLVNGNGETNNAQSLTKTQVADLHASTSCLKSFCTGVTADGIEDCRKACGGHGFLQASGLPELLGHYLQTPTVEGDNYMLPQQTVRVLLKIVQVVQSGDAEDVASYRQCDSYYLVTVLQEIMSNNGKALKCNATNREDIMDLNTLLLAFQHRAAKLLLDVAQQLEAQMTQDHATMQESWNDALIPMAKVSKAHSLFLLLNNYCRNLQHETRKSNLGSAELDVLQDLALLFGLYWMEKDIGQFLEDGYLSSRQSKWVRHGVRAMLKKVRPNAVALCDARDFSDFRLKSALGRKDGNVYPAIMESSLKDSLNATEPGPGYNEHLKKLIVAGAGVSGTVARL